MEIRSTPLQFCVGVGEWKKTDIFSFSVDIQNSHTKCCNMAVERIRYKITIGTNRPNKGNDADGLSLEGLVRVCVGVQVRRICVKSLCWELRKMREKIRKWKCKVDWKWEIRHVLKTVKWNCYSMCSEYHWISAMAGAVWTPVDVTLVVQGTDGRHIFSSSGTSSVWPIFRYWKSPRPHIKQSYKESYWVKISQRYRSL